MEGPAGETSDAEAEANPADSEAWDCLTLADLKADLAEAEEAVAGPGGKRAGAMSGEEELRLALQRSAVAASTTNFDAGAFFAAQRVLQGIAGDLHGVLVNAETLQFDNAALVASLVHGPLRPPLSTQDADEWTSPPMAAIFGPEAAPKAPEPVELSHPAQAPSLAEYQLRLESLPSLLFVGRSLRLCLGEVDRHQDEKDMQRDDLVVNGAAVSGSKGGYAAAHAAIAAALRTPTEAPTTLVGQAAEDAAQLLLSVLNRTCSGFAAFEEVQRLLDCYEFVVVSCDSASAKPLEAVILGGVALGRAHTRYVVHQADAPDGAPLAWVDAVFTFRVTTEMLQRLVTREVNAPSGWPAEDIAAAVLLCCGRPAAEAERPTARAGVEGPAGKVEGCGL